LSAGPVALAGTVTTVPTGILMVLLSPFTEEGLVAPGATYVVPDGARTCSPLVERVIVCPGASIVFVTTWRVRDCEAVVMDVAESVTVTVKVLVPTAVGVPEISPAASRDKPAGRVPLVTVQL
jgi:hypothetical protein